MSTEQTLSFYSHGLPTAMADYPTRASRPWYHATEWTLSFTLVACLWKKANDPIPALLACFRLFRCAYIQRIALQQDSTEGAKAKRILVLKKFFIKTRYSIPPYAGESMDKLPLVSKKRTTRAICPNQVSLSAGT